MPAPKDYYAVLGVPDTASADAVKKAYRRLAREHHPDKNPGDQAAEERFKELQEAYDTLSDAEKRRVYDVRRKNPQGGFDDFFTSAGGRYGARPDGTYVRFEGAPYGGGAGGPFGGAAAGEDPGLFGDLFGRIFGGGAPGGAPGGAGPRPGGARDTEAELRLTFEQALQGGPLDTRVGGEALRLTIPKGVPNGYKIRLRGRGPAGPGGPRGDLYVRFAVEPDPRFRRDGDDLTVVETISALEALLGTTRHVATAYGPRVKLTIPPGTQPGERLRLRGQGVDRGERKGDLYVEVAVAVPTLTPEQRDALKKAADAAGIR